MARAILTLSAFIVFGGCQPKSDGPWPEEAPLESPQKAPDSPDAGQGSGALPETMAAPGGLLGRRNGPILPLMPEDRVQVAVDLANEELEAQGYALRAEAVPTYQGTVDEVSFYAGEEALGWTPGRVIFVGTGELCASPPGYDGRLLVWVLAHELLHTVGFRHGDEMMALTNALGQRCRDYCAGDN